MAEQSSEYWRDRFQQLEEAQNDTSARTMQKIEIQFRRAEQALDEKINAWYQRFAVNNEISMTDARRLLNSDELEEFHWDVEDYIKYGKENAVDERWMKQLENASAKVHISRLEALKVQTQQEAEKLFGNYHDAIDKHISDIYTSTYYHTAFEVQRGVGVGWDMQRLNEEKVSNIIHKPWAADGRNFSDRIWTSKTQLINNLHDSLTRMCITGEAPDRAIRELSKSMGVSRSQAANIIQTESAAFSAKAQENCYSELDIEEFEVVETLDGHTCGMCGDMDGRHFPMKDFQIGVTAPPFHPRCRGCTCPRFNDEFTTGERVARGADGKKYYVPEKMTYNEWKKSFVDKEPSTTQEKTADYLIRSHTPGQNVTKERRLVNEAVTSVPLKVQQALMNTIIDVGKDGASQYDYENDILYVAKGAEKEDIIHEIGHLVENKMLDCLKVQNLVSELIGEVDIMQIRQEMFFDNNMNPHEVFLIDNPTFVSQYQGRVYCETIWDAFDENGDFRSDLLWEFFAEGFREYIENPENLRAKNPGLCDLIVEAVNE